MRLSQLRWCTAALPTQSNAIARSARSTIERRSARVAAISFTSLRTPQRGRPAGGRGWTFLRGSAGAMAEDLKRGERSGIGAGILYFNYGCKPDAKVKEQMHRFAEQIA